MTNTIIESWEFDIEEIVEFFDGKAQDIVDKTDDPGEHYPGESDWDELSDEAQDLWIQKKNDEAGEHTETADRIHRYLVRHHADYSIEDLKDGEVDSELSDFEEEDTHVKLREPVFRDSVDVNALIEIGKDPSQAEMETAKTEAYKENFKRMAREMPAPMREATERDMNELPATIVQAFLTYIDETEDEVPLSRSSRPTTETS